MVDFGKRLHYILRLGYYRNKYVLHTYFALHANYFIGSI